MNNRIKFIRKNLGFTQADFGDRIGVAGNTVTNYENGLRNPSKAVLKNICEEFNVSREWLETGEGEPFLSPTVSDDQFIDQLVGEYRRGDPVFKAFLTTYMRLSNAHRAVLDDIISQFVSQCNALGVSEQTASLEAFIESRMREERENGSGEARG